uniref:Uncharacterized protein n=1 Tax=Naja naja TaxID=35670 RepID=A0A8C6XS72_NAJNA
MRSEIEKYVKSCPVCAVNKTKVGKPEGLLQTVSEPTKPWQDIGMDFIVELPNTNGYNVIWTVIDLFSKQAHFIPCKGLPSARKLADLFIKHTYRLHGVPRRIISDRGVQFTAKFWREFVHLIGSTQGLSTAYHPCTNGAAERANATIEQYLRCCIYQQNDWVDLLPYAEIMYNNTVHNSTGYSPFQIVHGTEFVPIPEWPHKHQEPDTVNTWSDSIKSTWKAVQVALNKAQTEYKKQADKKRSSQIQYKVGDWVYLSTKYINLGLTSKKLGPKYIGPFSVSRIINPVTVCLRLPSRFKRIHPVFHINLLKPADMTRQNQRLQTPGPIRDDHYKIDKILDSHRKRGTLQYLVRWCGYPITDASWVPCSNVSAPRLRNRFHRSHPTKAGGRDEIN